MKLARKKAHVLELLEELGDPHTGHYLMRWSVNAGRMNYMARTTPEAVCREAAEAFDDAVLKSASALVGQRWTNGQAQQACFGTGHAGLGFRRMVDVLSAAYVGSGAVTHEICRAIRAEHRWDSHDTNSLLAHVHGFLCSAIDDTGRHRV